MVVHCGAGTDPAGGGGELVTLEHLPTYGGSDIEGTSVVSQGPTKQAIISSPTYINIEGKN